MFKTIMTVALVVALGLAGGMSAPAQTYDYEYDVSSGDWATANNWNPTSGPPTAGDTVLIGTAKTCRIETANQAAMQIKVDGTLIIKGKTLSMQGVGFDSAELDVDGTVEFQKPGGTTPKLRFGGTGGAPAAYISGDGTVLANGSSGHEGVMEEFTDVDTILVVSSGVTVRGSISLDTWALLNDGLFLVNNASDTMYLGDTSANVYTTGSGTLEVTAGDMFIRRLKPYTVSFTGELKVSGGTMTLTDDLWIFDPCDGKVTVSGGTLLFESEWHSTDGLVFTGGTIKVLDDETATFE